MICIGWGDKMKAKWPLRSFGSFWKGGPVLRWQKTQIGRTLAN